MQVSWIYHTQLHIYITFSAYEALSVKSSTTFDSRWTMIKDKRECGEVALPGSVEILPASNRNVFATNVSTQDLYTPNTTFDSRFGTSILAHGISVGGKWSLCTFSTA